MMLDLSIIIVNWNGKYHVRECVNSIHKYLKCMEYEIIIVDNNSHDGSQDFIKHNFPDVKLIEQNENNGFAKANNIGIKSSHSKYISFINSDVVLINNPFPTLIKFFESNTKIGLIGPQILNANFDIDRSCMGKLTLWNLLCRTFYLDSLFSKTKIFNGLLLGYWKHDSQSEVDVINGCFWFTTRTNIINVGYLDEEFFLYGEDRDLCKRFWDSGQKVVFTPSVKAIHFGAGSSSNDPKRFNLEQVKSNIIYLNKHYKKLKKHSFLVIYITHSLIRMILYFSLVTFNLNHIKYRDNFELHLNSIKLYFLEIFD